MAIPVIEPDGSEERLIDPMPLVENGPGTTAITSNIEGILIVTGRLLRQCLRRS